MVGHGVARSDRLVLGILRQELLPAHVGCGGFVHDEIRCECRCVDFVVVAAVADEGPDEIRSFNGLEGANRWLVGQFARNSWKVTLW